MSVFHFYAIGCIHPYLTFIIMQDLKNFSVNVKILFRKCGLIYISCYWRLISEPHQSFPIYTWKIIELDLRYEACHPRQSYGITKLFCWTGQKNANEEAQFLETDSERPFLHACWGVFKAVNILWDNFCDTETTVSFRGITVPIQSSAFANVFLLEGLRKEPCSMHVPLVSLCMLSQF